MEKLLDFNQPFDVPLLDQLVNQFFSGTAPPQVQALLVQFQAHPLAWTKVDTILQQSQNERTKIIALNILQDCIKTRWNILPPQQKEGIKTFLVDIIIQISKDPKELQAQAAVLNRLNLVLVQVLKHEWPHNWPNFIEDLVKSSRVSESLCANNMTILRYLSEEIFDYSAEDMTTEKIKNMKKNLNREFTLIFQLCEYIFDNSQDRVLLSTTLQTLQRFLSWIPVGFIFETKLVETLVLKFFPAPPFQNDTLLCLAEIGGLNLKDHPQYNGKFISLYASVTKHVAQLLTPTTDVAKIYATGNPTVQTFVRNLTIFISSFLKSHLSLLETHSDQTRQVLQISLTFLLQMSRVDDVTIFKICLECWTAIVTDLYTAQRSQLNPPALMLGQIAKPQVSPRMQIYQQILTVLRQVMISKMAKPEEVLIVEDENGEVVKQEAKDTDAIILYKSMRECLIYLTHLDPQDTQDTMLFKLSKQMDGSEWSHHNLNTLCWAVGSVSGALGEQQEKTFLVRVIKDLLHLCEMKRGKEHKAVIASNIMYVVGQYPRFLRMHWKFLRTVVNKLFEFMHEKYAGVQDMSCETFLKIATKCKKKFVVAQQGESRPYVEQILEELSQTISDLEQSQIDIFYEAVATIIQAQTDPEKRQALVFKLMAMPNQAWMTIITQANQKLEILWDPKTVRTINFVLKTNSRVASALGHGYVVQLSRIYLEMLHIYKLYSGYVSNEIKTKGVVMTQAVTVRNMRSVKKEVLKLIQTFIANSELGSAEQVFNNFVPPLIEPVLDDYKLGLPPARDAEVLALFAEVITKFGMSTMQIIPKLFDSLFQSTLQMITTDFTSFPEHRLQFFRMIRAINAHVFPSLLTLNPQQFQLVMDSIVWAFKHIERNVAELGLSTLNELLDNVQNSKVANQFYKTYLISLTQDLLSVMTDTFHKPGLQLQSQILARLFHVVETGAVTVPLWAPDQAFANNQQFVLQVVSNLIQKSFQTVTKPQIDQFVIGLFKHNNDQNSFKNHIRDFLITLKEFQSADNTDLYTEENTKIQQEKDRAERERLAQVPGLMYNGPGNSSTALEPDDDMGDSSIIV